MGRSRSSSQGRINHKAVGQRIKFLRRERGYSQQETADLLGMKQHLVSNLERGHTKLSFELAVVITEAFDVNLDALVVK